MGGGRTAAAPERVPRVARLLALAHKLQRLLDRGRLRSMADLARLGRVSRAHVAQAVGLPLLAPPRRALSRAARSSHAPEDWLPRGYGLRTIRVSGSRIKGLGHVVREAVWYPVGMANSSTTASRSVNAQESRPGMSRAGSGSCRLRGQLAPGGKGRKAGGIHADCRWACAAARGCPCGAAQRLFQANTTARQKNSFSGLPRPRTASTGPNQSPKHGGSIPGLRGLISSLWTLPLRLADGALARCDGV